MSNHLKSGEEILDDFFDSIQSLPGVDKKIADVLVNLYEKDRFSAKSLSNALLRLREEEVDEDEDQEA